MLVYDITNAKSFDNIAKWLRNIDEHANEVRTVPVSVPKLAKWPEIIIISDFLYVNIINNHVTKVNRYRTGIVFNVADKPPVAGHLYG